MVIHSGKQHTADTRVSCELHEKTLSNKSNLKTKARADTKETSCEVCGKTFTVEAI